MLAVGLIVGSVIAWWVSPAPAPDGSTGAGEGDADAGDGDASTEFSVTGDLVTEISPGVSAPLDLEFANIHDSVIRVDGLVVTVGEVSAPNASDALPCDRSDFEVTQLAADVTLALPARSVSTLSGLRVDAADWPQVGMIDSAGNQDGCKGASLALHYSARGDSR